MVYNSVDHSYIRNTTDKLNARINQGKVYGYSSPSEEMTQICSPEPEQANTQVKQEPTMEAEADVNKESAVSEPKTESEVAAEPVKKKTAAKRTTKTSSLTDDDYDLILEKLIRDRQQRKRKEKDFEM